MTQQKQIMPAKVKQCVTHHFACDCQQWRYEQLERALSIIRMWASDISHPEHQDHILEHYCRTINTIKDIEGECADALGCLDGKEDECYIRKNHIIGGARK